MHEAAHLLFTVVTLPCKALTLAANVLWMAFELQVSGGRTGYDVQVYAQQISEDRQGWRVVKLPWKATGPYGRTGSGTYWSCMEQDREIHVLDVSQLR